MSTAVHTTSAFAAPSAPALPTPNPDVVFRAMPDGGVLFAPKTEAYYGLNTTGAFVWEHLAPTCSTLDELCERFLARFPGAPVDRARQDVEALLAMLGEHGLVVAR